MKRDILTVPRMHTIMSDYISDLEKQIEEQQKRLALCEQVIDEQSMMINKIVVLLSRSSVDNEIGKKSIKFVATSYADTVCKFDNSRLLPRGSDMLFVGHFYDRVYKNMENGAILEYFKKYGDMQNVKPRHLH